MSHHEDTRQCGGCGFHVLDCDCTAWMGGSSPGPLRSISAAERRSVRHHFREQVGVWVDGWGDFPDLDVCRTFWNRARHDAHATYRNRGAKKAAGDDGPMLCSCGRCGVEFVAQRFEDECTLCAGGGR